MLDHFMVQREKKEQAQGAYMVFGCLCAVDERIRRAGKCGAFMKVIYNM